MTQTNEQTIIQQAQHDPQAFAILYDRYIDRIYAYTLRQTGNEALAQDATSATFEKALRHLRRYRWQGQTFCAWLYRIARNEAIAIHRKQRFLAPLSLGRLGEPNAEQVLDTQLQSDDVQLALARLPGRDQELLILRFYEDLSNAEIASILGCSVQSLYVRVHRALSRLRKELEAIENVSGEVVQGE